MRRTLGLMLVLSLFVGCGGDASNTKTDPKPNGTGASGGSATKQLRIAVIPKGTSHVFWKSVHAGAEKAAKELGNVEILWKGPLLEHDRDGQISVVQDFVTKKVDGICLAPLDKQALIGPVHEAVEAGIPVIVFDSALQDESKIVSYVATDNYKGGQLAGRQMGETLGGKGGVVMLRYYQGSESTEQREEGFLDTLKKDFPDIKVLSSDQYAGTTPEDSLAKATEVLNKFKDEVNGIFAVCEPNAAGVLGALKETELGTKVKFIAFDPSEDLIRAMEAGTCHGIVLQDPVTMGYESIMALVKKIRGETIEKRIGTGEFLATPENMKTPEMDKLLSPERFE
ncbi:MAG: substrate-binding domain-containing protein [Planctomycetota bacterium]